MRKKYTYTSEKELEGLRWTAKVVDFGVALSVIAALNEVYTAHMMLREHKDLYRREVKHLANKAIEQARLCRGRMLSVMASKQFFDTYSDRVIDLAEQDITLFRIGIKQTLDDHHYPNADLCSYMETARSLLNMAAVHFQGVIQKATEDFGPNNFKAAFSEFDCSPVLNVWDRLCVRLYGMVPDVVDVNTERNKQLFDIMANKFADGAYVDACMEEARKECPDFVNTIVIKKE